MMVHLFRALLRAFGQLNAKGGMIMSSHVAMSMMLALFPFIMFVMSLATALSQHLFIDDLIAFIFGTWPESIARPIEIEVRAVIASSGQELITIGGLLAVFFASNGIDAVREALSRAYRDADPRPYWLRRAVSLVFVIMGAALVLLFATIGLGVPIYMQFANEVAPWIPDLVFNNEVLLRAGSIFLVLGAVAACHVWLPYGAHPLRQIWPGVLLTIVLWFAVAEGFSIYIKWFSSYTLVYAGLAGAMVALIFLNLMSVILIFGAEFNAALIDDKATKTP